VKTAVVFMAKRNGTPIPNTQGSYISAIENSRKAKISV